MVELGSKGIAMVAQGACGKPVLVNETVLWLIDEKIEQSRTLSSLIGDRFALSCTVSTLRSIENNQLNASFKHFFLVDCESYSVEEVKALLWRFHSLNERVKVVLFNVSENNGYDEFVEWPQLVGMLAVNSSTEHLLKGIAEVLNEGHWLPRHLISKILQTKRQAPGVVKKTDKLTRREVQILQHLNQGLTNLEIGELIHVSGHTVRTHLYNVYKKIGVKNRTQACNWLQQNL